jgi:hypothetical protein
MTKVRMEKGTREGFTFKFVGEMPEGSDWTPHPSGDGVIIVHPDHPPEWVHDDGRIEEIHFQTEPKHG